MNRSRENDHHQLSLPQKVVPRLRRSGSLPCLPARPRILAGAEDRPGRAGVPLRLHPRGRRGLPHPRDGGRGKLARSPKKRPGQERFAWKAAASDAEGGDEARDGAGGETEGELAGAPPRPHSASISLPASVPPRRSSPLRPLAAHAHRHPRLQGPHRGGAPQADPRVRARPPPRRAAAPDARRGPPPLATARASEAPKVRNRGQQSLKKAT